MRLQPLRRLPGVADGPAAVVELAGSVLDAGLLHAALALYQLDILLAVLLADELVGEAQLLGELVHDHLVGARLEQRADHLLAPLPRAVGGGHAALALELGRRRQAVRAVLPRP